MTDYWQMLGIEPTTDKQIIREAYRKKLPEYHPETDPAGFQQLRKAYEAALNYTEEPEALISVIKENRAPLIVDDRQHNEPTDLFDLPVDPIAASLLQAFEQLLSDPQRCYQPDAWQDYISLLGEHPIDVIQQISWPLLWQLLQAPAHSYDCATLLIERMRWRERLSELSRSQAEPLDDYLLHQHGTDLFDFSTLSQTNRAAQMATVDYFRDLHQIYFQRPSSRFQYYIEQPTVICWPDAPYLYLDLISWCSHLGISQPTFYQDIMQKHIQLDNPNWLHAAAYQSMMRGDQQQAIDYWFTLYELTQSSDAVEQLLAYYASHQPDYVPLLIQAFDITYYADWDNGEFNSSNQRNSVPTQHPATLLRWMMASRLSLSPVATAYVEWKVTNQPLPVNLFKQILTDGGDNLLLHYYRHASMLMLGNEVLLDAILEEPQPIDPLLAFILTQLQRQARQQLFWLNNSQAIACFTDWLYADDQAAFPEKLTYDQAAEGRLHIIGWLQRLRWLPNKTLKRFYRSHQFNSDDRGLFDWLFFLSMSDEMNLAPPLDLQSARAYWIWYRVTAAFVLFLEYPAEFFPLIRNHFYLITPKKHPLRQYADMIETINPDQADWADCLAAHLSLSDHLDSCLFLRLPISTDYYLNRFDIFPIYFTYKFSQSIWLPQLSHSSVIDRLLLAGVFIQQNEIDWIEKEECLRFINSYVLSTPQETSLHQWLVSEDKTIPASLRTTLSKSQQIILQAIRRLKTKNGVLSKGQCNRLTNIKNNPDMDICLRLAAGTLIGRHTLRKQPNKSISWIKNLFTRHSWLTIILIIFIILNAIKILGKSLI